MSAGVERETFGPVTAEIHRITTDDDVPLVLTRVPPIGEDPHGTPVVLIHGSYSKRNFWVSPKGIGLAPFLAGRGFDCWVPDLRAHGLSPRTERYGEFIAEHHMCFDLPAVQAFVREQTGQREFMTGHSAGGLFIYGAIAAGWLRPDLRGLVVLGAQIARGDRKLKLPPVVWALKLMMWQAGCFPSRRLGMGPEDEPSGMMLEFVRWKGLGGRWTTQDGRSYHEGMRNVTAPLLAFAAAKDTNDPPRGCRELFDEAASEDRRFVLLGKKHGFSMDYGHVEMIVSKAAQQEVWPMIGEWLDERR